ncbi:MAG: DUF4445 domain-containing protein [Betaproteobacteria bacterium]|nr:MAG: DUF4445 domain-containing protein [Betaproteobacteria bacterium]
MTQTVSVTFFDPETGQELARATVPRGTTVLEAGLAAGTEITATCGRRGRCRSCRVKVLAGEIAPPTLQDTIQLGPDGVRERFRLSCQMPAVADCSIAVMPEHGELGHQILADAGSFAPGAMPLESGIEKHLIRAQAPQDENHQTSDIEQILGCLPAGISRLMPLSVYRKLPTVLREELGQLTVTTFLDQIIDVEAGDSSAQLYGMALDIGTTTVVATLHSLRSGEQLAATAAVNPQSVFGGDLMSRIAYAQFDQKKLQVLRGRILNQINGFIEALTQEAGVAPEHLYKIVIAGNTCMHHLCLGIDTSYVGLAPYAPVVRDPIVVPASEIPFKRAPNARVCFLPILAGFVGADTIAGIIATRIYESEGIRLLVDIGTNGEVVLGSKDRLLVCSAPAGPTFEGGQVKHGMRGAVGAIEKVAIGADVECDVIGEVPAIGICGSGLIDAVAKMRDAGVLDAAGRLWRPGVRPLPEALQARVVKDGSGRAFVLVHAAQGGRGEDVVLTQNDIRQLQLAKAAIYGGVLMLQRIMGVRDDQIEEVMLSGGFGNYVSIESAVSIGLLPPVPLERISYVGNAALLGAQLALLSETERARAFDIARSIEHVALATRPEFQDIFIEACALSAAPTGNQFGKAPAVRVAVKADATQHG